MTMYGYIYKTTNLINSKIYVGQKKSKKFIKSYKGSGVNIKRAIKKYGIDNFHVEIIQWCETKEDLDLKEKYWIKKLKSQWAFGNGYNITDGGEFGDTFTHLTPEERERRVQTHRDNNILPEWTEERRIKQSKMFSGKGNPMYGVESPMKNKKLPAYRIEQLRKQATGVIHSDKTKEKIKKSQQDRWKNKTQEEKNESTKHLKEWYENNPRPQNKKVYVYKNDELFKTFVNKKECIEYFKELGLGKKSIERNLVKNKPLFSGKRVGLSEQEFNKLKKFKDYEFSYIQR